MPAIDDYEKSFAPEPRKRGTPGKVPVTVNGKRVGWAYERDDGRLDIDITDDDTMRMITKGLTEGLSIAGTDQERT